MKLKDIKNSASRLIQNALQVFAVTCIYGYDMRKKQRELRYRLDTIRQKVQQTIIKDDIYHKMLDKVHPDWARLGRYDLDRLFSEYENCIVQISYLNKDLHSLNDRPNNRQRRWRERFTLDLNTIWDVAADHQWAIQNDIDYTIRSYSKDYEGSLSAYSPASTYASNNSIWCTSSMSGSSCYAQSLSGSSLTGSSISLQSLCAAELMVESLREKECEKEKEKECEKEKEKESEKDNADELCDGQYENDLLEFLNGFQFDC